MSPSADWFAVRVEVELWRDYDPAVRALPGTGLGARTLDGRWSPAASRLDEAGVRYARLADPVRLCARASAESARALVLIRELTGRGVAVEWTAVCDDGCAGLGRYSHLYPPAALDGAPERTLRDWRSGYFPDRCVFRAGPGFLEVRDRRRGTLELITIDEPAHLAAVEAMTEGVPAGAVPGAVRRDLDDLIAEHAGHLWWLPWRIRRWPFPPLTV